MTPLVRMLAQYWRLDERLARRWWEGVARARWSLAQGWRRQVLLFDKGIAPTLAAPQVCEAARRRTRSGGFRRSSDGSGRSSTRPRSRGRADGTEAPRRPDVSPASPEGDRGSLRCATPENGQAHRGHGDG